MRFAPLALLAAAALALAGCAASPTPASPTSSSTPTAETAAVIDNCGTKVEVPASAPQRIVTIKSTSTELLLALGLGDRIVGSAFQDGPVPAEYEAEAAKISVISDFAPSQEAVLDLEPDFVFAGWESMLTPEAAGDRATLSDLGVGSYVAPSACKEAAYKPTKLSYDEVFAGITEAAQLFGATDAAAALVAEQRVALAEVTPDGRGLSALWYSSGDDTPYVGAGIGAPQMMMEQIGLSNIAADIDDTWASLSWEAIVAADPDVIVLVDASWNSAASKITALETNPATAGLSAVQNKRYLTIPFAAGEAGVRNVAAAADLEQQLGALTFG